MAKLAIIMEGGLIQSVVSDDPGAITLDDLLVIDYDTEGCDDADISEIRQEDGTFAKAYVSHFDITRATIDLDNTEDLSKNFWISWYSPKGEGFTLNTPWWISGETGDDRLTICAAIRAKDEDDVALQIQAAYDNPHACLEWRFTEERNSFWSPFCSRFPQASWMQW